MKKILIIILSLILTGCWNYRELNEYAIATGLAIDIKDNEYEVSLLFANGKKNKNEENQINVLSGTGNTIYEAINNIGLSTPKEIYISHLSVVIISDEVAKKGVKPILDYLLREPQSNENFYIILSKESNAKNVLSIIAPQSDFPSQNITSSIKINEELQGRITDSSFNIFVSKILEKGNNPIANSIIIIGDDEKGTKKMEQENTKVSAYTKLDKIGIFKDDKLIEWANIDESIGINMLLGNINSLYITLPCDNNKTIVKINNYKINNKVYKDKININIKSSGIVNEVGCKINLNNEKELNKIENEVKNEMRNKINDAIKIAKKLETDIFGYGNMIYKKYPNYYNKIKNWNLEFKNLNINTNIDFRIDNKGSAEQSIGELANE